MLYKFGRYRSHIFCCIVTDICFCQQDFSGTSMSERFPARKGISASLRDRLGDLGNNRDLKADWKENDPNNRRPFEIDRHRSTVSSKTRRIEEPKDYDSGDSLEMDQGEDLRGELDGQHAANMVIQV